MVDAQTLAQINGKYLCPADAGPEWRASSAAGYDMSLLEHTMELTPAQRIEEHQRVLETLLEIQAAGGHEDAK
ncbi:MAG TPA: hypothetical protein VHH88_13735 [Verrucomicrobiae bacterium]|nr:hypothetical protein [Verrucomicrobiae bacterium]